MTAIIAQKGLNFLFDCGIALKVLQEFQDVVFIGVAIPSLLTEEEVESCLPRLMAKKGHNY